MFQPNVCISMNLIMGNYRVGQAQHQDRLKLNNGLSKTFGDKILFLIRSI